MNENRKVKISKYLAKHLRHQPERIGLVLDPHGWTPVDDLLRAATAHGFPFTRTELDEVVADNDKQRYAFDADGTRIRANQGHSVTVDLDLPVAEPPEWLYHGTVARFLPTIRAEGLRPMNRHAVHLSPDHATAVQVGARRGQPVVLAVRAGQMRREGGFEFRCSANGVWLVAAVPAEWISWPADH
ncbi:RNA 2'-phosphotransferase [Streptomyces odontomachi]|uniref:RNA 2'-phosphotransferase n=1 Tax=Streptomyces odontomachi TaxID=2944940 RepID=UPI00210CDF4B|nr:RNA 2'-phosphotransferase [Streptomyces sp. ODS25]